MPSSVIDLDAAEDSPLLDAGERVDEPISPKPKFITTSRWQVKSPSSIVLLVAVTKFFITGSGMMILIPMYRLIEDALCHVYYQDDSPDLIEEMECKVDEVQSQLAFMLGWFNLLTAVTNLLVAFPYGMLADRIGRKPTAFMAYLGLAISFAFTPIMLGYFKATVRRNPYILMFGCVLQLFGGGITVLFATLYAVAADVSSDQDKASSFLYLTFGATAGGLVGPLATGILMTRYGPWVPIWVVLAITPPMLCVFFFLPETLSIDVKVQRTEYQPPLVALRTHISTGLRDLFRSFGMLKNPNVPLVLVTFLFQNARFTAHTSTIAQYISKHFGWRLAETSLLLSPLGVLNLILLAVLPRISQLLMSSRFGFTSFRKDLFLTRVSTLLLLTGAFIEGSSHNVVLFIFGLFVSTFGAADSPLARATVTHFIEPEFTSRLYALIGMSEVLGSFIGGPVLALLFTKGLQWKGIFMGLPFYYIGFLCFLAYFALLFVRAPAKKEDDDDTIYGDGEVNELPEGHLRTD